MIGHIFQNTVVPFLKITVAAILFGHSAGVTVDRIGLVIQFRRRAAETKCNLPDDQLRGGIAGVSVLRCFQIGTIRVTVCECQRQ